MELQLILINNQALCLHRSTLNGPVTTLKLRGEPINAVEFPSEYLERVCSQLGGVSLSQLTVSLTHDQVNEQTLRNWGMALVCAERLNIGRLRARLPRPISPHEQLELTEEGISCVSGSSRQALMSFEALGTTMSPSAPLTLSSQVEAPVMSGPHPEVLERLEALELKVQQITYKEEHNENISKEVFRQAVAISNISSESALNVLGREPYLTFGYKRKKTVIRAMLENGSKVSSGMNILEIVKRGSVEDKDKICIASHAPSGHVYYLIDDKKEDEFMFDEGGVEISKDDIIGDSLIQVFAVISSDPNDTLPQIKAWLAMNNIPFYQGG